MPAPIEAIATGGSLSVALFGNPPVQDSAGRRSPASMSVRQLADAINAQANSPVNASVVQAAPGQYRLVLTGRNSGTANAFTVTSTLTGGTGLTFTDTDTDGTYGDSAGGPLGRGDQRRADGQQHSDHQRDQHGRRTPCPA